MAVISFLKEASRCLETKQLESKCPEFKRPGTRSPTSQSPVVHIAQASKPPDFKHPESKCQSMPPEFNFSSIPFSVKFIIVSSPEVQTFEMYMLESALKSAGHL